MISDAKQQPDVHPPAAQSKNAVAWQDGILSLGILAYGLSGLEFRLSGQKGLVQQRRNSDALGLAERPLGRCAVVIGRPSWPEQGRQQLRSSDRHGRHHEHQLDSSLDGEPAQASIMSISWTVLWTESGPRPAS